MSENKSDNVVRKLALYNTYGVMGRPSGYKNGHSKPNPIFNPKKKKRKLN